MSENNNRGSSDVRDEMDPVEEAGDSSVIHSTVGPQEDNRESPDVSAQHIHDDESGQDSTIEEDATAEDDRIATERLKNSIVDNDEDDVVSILQSNPDVLEAKFDFIFEREQFNELTGEALTPLVLAAGLGQRNIVDILMDRGADFGTRTRGGQSPFFMATHFDHRNTATQILEKGGNDLLEFKNSWGVSPLLDAVFGARHETLAYLLHKGAKITIKDLEDSFRRFSSQISDKAELSAALCGCWSAFGDFFQDNVPWGSNNQGNTALHLACMGILRGRVDVKKLEYMRIINALLTEHGGLLEKSNDAGETPLLTAACWGYWEAFEYLARKGANLSAQNSNKDTALHLACKGTMGSLSCIPGPQHTQIIGMLLQYKIDIMEQPNESGETPLLVAARCGQFGIVKLLLDKEAYHLASDDEGNTVVHLCCRFQEEDTNPPTNPQGCLNLVKRIVKDHPELLDKRNNDGETPVLIAAMKDHLGLVEFFHKQNANIESRDVWGFTPLLNSTFSSSTSVMRYLLNDNADLTAITNSQNNILEIACQEPNPDVIQIILRLQRDQLRPLANGTNKSGQTPLMTLIETGDQECIVLLLESHIYVPDDPCLDEIHYSPEPERGIVSSWLSEGLDEKNEDTTRFSTFKAKIDFVIYWALSNGDNNLLKVAMKHITSIELEKGNTWLHFFARVGNIQSLNLLKDWESYVLQVGTKKMTPLHLAASRENTDLAERFLDSLHTEGDSAEYQSGDARDHAAKSASLKILDAILQETEDLDTVISLAVRQQNSTLERSLWIRALKLVQIHNIFLRISLEERRIAEFVMGVAAWRYTTGEPKYLYGFMNVVRGLPSNQPGQQPSPLKFIVENNFPVALWWLLSSGRYLGETDIKECEKLTRSETSLKDSPPDDEVQRILKNPPPIRAQVYDGGRPQFKHDPPAKGSLIATLLDFSVKPHQVNLKLRRADIDDLIRAHGPESIMADNEFHKFQDYKNSLWSSTGTTPETEPQAHGKETKKTGNATKRKVVGNKNDSKNEKKGNSSDFEQSSASGVKHKFRWIHLPKNDLQYVEDLMVRLSVDRGRSNSEHFHLAGLVEKSWMEIPSGGKTFYMRPNCQIEKSDKAKMLSLYVPYIFWRDAPARNEVKPSIRKGNPDYPGNGPSSKFKFTSQSPDSKNTEKRTGNMTLETATNQPQGPRNSANHDRKHNQEDLDKTVQLDPYWPQSEESIGKRVIHKDLTLDQYYYESLQDTNSRDCSQVLGRLFDHESTKTDNKGNPAGQSGKNTIITSTTEESKDIKKTFFQRVFDNIHQTDLDKLYEDDKHSPVIYHLADIIMDTARGLFDARDIELNNSEDSGISPFDAYRKSIQRMRDYEIKLFTKFREALDKTNSKKSQTIPQRFLAFWRSSRTPNKPREGRDRVEMGNKIEGNSDISDDLGNPYENILDETRLLEEIKDVLDELNILKALSQDQERVDNAWKRVATKVKISRAVSASEIKIEVESMIEDAKSVQGDINSLLDLKQKEAGIVEAQATRRQSDTVMTFTIVTIIFLPASFLTSLFALNVSDFPHQNGSVEYKGSWIFPIIFGVSTAISAIFIALAFNTNGLKRYTHISKENMKESSRARIKGIFGVRGDGTGEQRSQV
ncbi:hypothetical protein N7481_003199 [Penicillium waksmanii]|uniref:uncharacterized protein n=1 Tax=Penicillium waksmanii TaxID=69791 RepID=UPI002547E753|nr:uncharacterized protein N7481_003199 [Penicillium waksmanii]KAJ5987989.1 hypothetical protein N7481_003199 [Penicillium waksmanii]